MKSIKFLNSNYFINNLYPLLWNTFNNLIIYTSVCALGMWKVYFTKCWGEWMCWEKQFKKLQCTMDYMYLNFINLTFIKNVFIVIALKV